MPPEEREGDPSLKGTNDSVVFASHQARESTSWMPWLIAAGIVLAALGVVILLGGHGTQNATSTSTGMAAPDPYAVSLPINGLQMSEATSFSGAKVTYVDGRITNMGNRTLTAITVQVGFHSDVGQYAQRLALPLSLIRTREPYVDTQAVASAPIRGGDSRDFRLIFDAVPADWNLQYPEIRVIGVRFQ